MQANFEEACKQTCLKADVFQINVEFLWSVFKLIGRKVAEVHHLNVESEYRENENQMSEGKGFKW